MTDYERFANHESDRGHTGIALSFMFIGLGIGALAALLLAPRSGRQLRRSLRRRYEDAREAVGDWGDRAGDYVGKGGDWARTAAKERVGPLASRFGG